MTSNLSCTLPMACIVAAFGLAGTLPAPAHAGAPSSSNRYLTADEALAAAKARALALRQRAAQSPSGLDTTPPVLHSISTSGSIDASLSNQSAEVDLDITDDLSGVAYYIVEYVSPTGLQQIWHEKYVATPLLHVSPAISFGQYPFSDPGISGYSQTGDWDAWNVFVYDAAGNEAQWDASQLFHLGTTTFNVKNSHGFDLQNPHLKSGTIDTPVISLSTPPKGTPVGTEPYASGQVSLTDKGNGEVSGIYEAFYFFCSPDIDHCNSTLKLTGTTNHTGLKQGTITVGAQVPANQPLGQYVLRDVYVYDVAGNWYPYGGSDVSKAFPGGTTITVTP